MPWFVRSRAELPTKSLMICGRCGLDWVQQRSTGTKMKPVWQTLLTYKLFGWSLWNADKFSWLSVCVVLVDVCHEVLLIDLALKSKITVSFKRKTEKKTEQLINSRDLKQREIKNSKTFPSVREPSSLLAGSCRGKRNWSSNRQPRRHRPAEGLWRWPGTEPGCAFGLLGHKAR